MSAEATRPGFADVAEARVRVAGVVRETPVYRSEAMSTVAGRRVLLKAECLQRTGSFKLRGAYNTIAQLGEDERRRGVVTASAGNHGQAVAWAAREIGAIATIFVPESAPMPKIEAARGYGAEVVRSGDSFDDTVLAAEAFRGREGATYVHAFDDPRVIAGQGTLGLELAAQVPEGAGVVVVPIGGGGLVSGIAIALRELRPDLRVVGVQASACAPFAGRAPSGATIADGIAVKVPGRLTAPIVAELVDEIVVVDDDEISRAIVFLLERAKVVAEGAGAAAVAALLARKVAGDDPACAVVAGGNIDPTTLISVVRYGLTSSGRYLVVGVLIPDRPGQLAQIVATVARERANIISIEHHREGRNIGVLQTEAELTLETRDEEHSRRVVEALEQEGYLVRRAR
ncbi:MAG: threonine ammonia-lyase [Gaiella sp.]